MRLLLGVFLLVPSLALALSPESIPAPTATNWVIDLTGRIPAEDVAAANALAHGVNQAKHGQVAVLVIDSTDGKDPRSFAEDVHHQWRLGTGRGDGILFFVALDDRAAETLLPYGLRSDVDQRASDTAMQQVIVPAFKRGALGEAIREGTRALVQLLENSPLNSPAAEHAPETVTERTWRSPSQLPNPAARGFSVDAANAMSETAKAQLESALNGLYADGHGKLYVYVVRGSDFQATPRDVAESLYARLHPDGTPGVQVAVIAIDSEHVAVAGKSSNPSADGWALDELREQTARELRESPANPDEAVVRFASGYDALVTYGPRVSNYTGHAASLLSNSVSNNSGAFGFGGFALFGGGALGLMKWLRVRKRRCKVCGDHRLKLDEQSDDAYLSAGQKHEEDLKSVDYDVWWCARCEDALVLRYRAWFTAYKTCPKCDFVCAMQTTTTLVHASYSSGGQVQVTLNCNRCGHHASHIRYTPRLQRSSSSSSRSSFSSSSGRSSFGGSSGRW